MPMLTERELIGHWAFWLDTNQNAIYRLVVEFQERNKYDKKQLAEALGCTQRMAAQLLNGSINCSMEKFFKIITNMGLCPVMTFPTLDEHLADVLRAKPQ